MKELSQRKTEGPRTVVEAGSKAYPFLEGIPTDFSFFNIFHRLFQELIMYAPVKSFVRP